MSAPALIDITGGYHCGDVRYRVRSESAPEMLDGNCSICSATGYVSLIIKHGHFELLQCEGRN